LQGRVPWYAIAGAAGQSVIPSYVTLGNSASYFQILFGLSAIAAALQYDKQPGVPMWLRSALEKVGGRRSGVKAVPVTPVPVIAATPASASTAGLEVSDITVRFGGITAVSNVTLKAPMGRITGLIGPNGAGKTTLFNVCSGIVKPTRGHVSMQEQNISDLPIAARARQGLGRTFQIVRLFNSLSVRENVSLGREASMAGRNPITQMRSRRAEGDVIKASVSSASSIAGIDEFLGRSTAQVTTGQKRLVELARCLAGPFEMLLLDEPSSGLDSNETEHFGEAIRTVASERGCGIFLVEHDMGLVRQVCDYVYVMDFGRLIFEGSPEEMANSQIVRDAYLGASASTALAGPAQEDAASDVEV